MDVYRPKAKIAVASSFEGIVNNGATECALTSFNAYHQMPEGEGKFFGRVIEPGEFVSQKLANHKYVRAFLALRPLVGVAEDYLTVMEVIDSSPEGVEYMLNHPNEERAYTQLIEKFKDFKGNADVRQRFGFGEDSAFYKERKRMQAADRSAWMGTQEPYQDAINQFRKLINTQQRVDDSDVYKAVVSGFVPWFATSKDEYSTQLLCEIYTEMERVPEDFTKGPTCVISNERIIGKDAVPDRDKVKQLKIIAEKEDVPHSQVWRLNDMYRAEKDLELRDAGFHNQFIVPGYMFPHDVQKAREDKDSIVLERDNFAAQLGEYAKAWRF
jgi:hypothetical protein